MDADHDSRKHSTIEKALKNWLKSQDEVKLLPMAWWIVPLNVDILAQRNDPRCTWRFDLYEIKVTRRDLQSAPYQLEAVRICFERKGATRCYVVIPDNLARELERFEQYPLFMATMKRFGYGVIILDSKLDLDIRLKPKTFRKRNRSHKDLAFPRILQLNSNEGEP